MNKPEPTKTYATVKPHTAAPKSEAPVTDKGKAVKAIETLEAQSLTSEQQAAVDELRKIVGVPDVPPEQQ